MEVAIRTDGTPTDTGWIFRARGSGSTIRNRPPGFYTTTGLFSETVSVTCGVDYRFTISDVSNDGLGAGAVPGGYALSLPGLNIPIQMPTSFSGGVAVLDFALPTQACSTTATVSPKGTPTAVSAAWSQAAEVMLDFTREGTHNRTNMQLDPCRSSNSVHRGGERSGYEARRIACAHGGLQSTEKRFLDRVWIRGALTRLEGSWSQSEAHIVTGTVGLDLWRSERTLFGILAGFENTGVDAQDTKFGFSVDVSGQGPTVAAYAGLRLAERVVLDAMGGYSWVNYEATVDAIDLEFFARRWIAAASLAGQIDIGKLRIEPNLRVQLAHETHDQHTSSQGVHFPQRAFFVADFAYGARASRQFQLAKSLSIKPWIKLEGEHQIVDGDEDAVDLSIQSESSVRIGGGMLLSGYGGIELDLAGHARGIGSPVQLYQGSIKFTVPF